MCGITGRVGRIDAVPDILSGLKNLEYRGYDSAGIAVLGGTGIEVYKCSGEVNALCQSVETDMPSGEVAIGHTRWSTHGPPTDRNAHPHVDCTGHVAVVHNGIITNYDELREQLASHGHDFVSDTDTEVIPHLVESNLAAGFEPLDAFRHALDALEGSFAVAMLVDGQSAVYAARVGSPLVLGLAEEAFYLASDVPAFLEATNRVVFMEDGDVAVLTSDDYYLSTLDGRELTRPVVEIEWVAEDAERGGFDHYMLKEIYEQPAALARTLDGRVHDGAARLDELPADALAGIERVHLIGCGTSYHAAMVGAHHLESHGIPARALLASEYAISPPPADEHTLVVGVTQSGETADTLSALRTAKRSGLRTLALTNVLGSTATRECDHSVFIRAGPEIGVAATKTFSSQVVTLWLLCDRLVRERGGTGDPDLLTAARSLPDHTERVIAETDAKGIVDRFAPSESYFFIGRGPAFPVALEGALKFKEITYEHAEGFAGGELKHGPLALVSDETPVFAVFTGENDEKLLSNVEEVQTRGAPVIAIAPESSTAVARTADAVLTVPDAHPSVVAVLANVQLQLIAYHAADLLDRPIDKPRNLAKSVTVE
jgi:glucosamine--fructose-6-phosphate aminotransferase (isomerizing)